MNKPKLPSELHPDYPKPTIVQLGNEDSVMGILGSLTKWPPPEVYMAFYAAHPEFKDEGEYVFRCEMCGGDVDDDHCYCPECKDHAGSWVLVDADGEEISA